MVKHIVIYQLREDCDKQAAVQEISQALESLVGVIPGLQWLEVCPHLSGGMRIMSCTPSLTAPRLWPDIRFTRITWPPRKWFINM